MQLNDIFSILGSFFVVIYGIIAIMILMVLLFKTKGNK